MTTSVDNSMNHFAAADPALTSDVDAASPTLEQVWRKIDAATESTPRPGTPHRPGFARGRGRTRLVIVGVAAAAAAFISGIVTWPWSASQPAARAYGVTTQADGTINVRLPLNTPYDPTLLQEKLRAAGVPAVVLIQSVAGACHEPQPDNIPSAGTIITSPDYAHRQDGFTIHPTAIPAGATLIVALPFPGELGDNNPAGQAPSLVALSVTMHKPPTCVPQSVFLRSRTGTELPAPTDHATPTAR